MVQETDVLLTIAELGIAFAGFGAMVTIIGRRSTSPRAPLHAARLHLVVLTGLHLVIASVIPIVISRYGVGDEWIWRGSSGAVLALDYALIVGFYSWYRQQLRRAPASPAVSTIYTLLWAAFQLPLFLVLLRILSEFASALYLSALLAGLLNGAFMFILLIHSLLAANEEE